MQSWRTALEKAFKESLDKLEESDYIPPDYGNILIQLVFEKGEIEVVIKERETRKRTKI